MKVQINKLRAHVTITFNREGSVLKHNVTSSCDAVETRLEIDSPESAEKVASVVRNAENGCFVMQALSKPVPVSSSTTLNGEALTVKA